MTDVIEAIGLTKRYGSRRGIVDVDFQIQESEVFGFLGPNGAGKTTTIRVLLGFLRPTAGRATVFGPRRLARRRRPPTPTSPTSAAIRPTSAS